MLMRHFLWWHRHDADRTEVLVIFETAPDFLIVSVSDAAGIEQALTDDEHDALRTRIEAQHPQEEQSRAA